MDDHKPAGNGTDGNIDEADTLLAVIDPYEAVDEYVPG